MSPDFVHLDPLVSNTFGGDALVGLDSVYIRGVLIYVDDLLGVICTLILARSSAREGTTSSCPLDSLHGIRHRALNATQRDHGRNQLVFLSLFKVVFIESSICG